MADIILSNSPSAGGIYNGIDTAMTSPVVTVLLIDGLEITLAADHLAWINGPLTFTVTVSNTASYPFMDPVITDVLDPAVVTLIESTVQVGGTDVPYTYDDVTGTLTVALDTLGIDDTAVLTFQVTRA